MSQTGQQVNLEARLRTMRILWGAFLATMVMYALLAYFILPPADPAAGARDDSVLLGVLLALGFSMIVLSFVVKRIFLARAVREQNVAGVQTAFIIAVVFCESGGLFGFMAYLITHHPYSFLLFLAAAAGIVLHVPRLGELYAAAGGRGGGEWGSTSFK